MSRVIFNHKDKKVLNDLLLGIPGVIAGRMVGHPAYYVDRELFAGIFDSGSRP
jgi:hypothetical protein